MYEVKTDTHSALSITGITEQTFIKLKLPGQLFIRTATPNFMKILLLGHKQTGGQTVMVFTQGSLFPPSKERPPPKKVICAVNTDYGAEVSVTRQMCEAWGHCVVRGTLALHNVLQLNSPLHAVTMFIQGKHRCGVCIRSNCVLKIAKFISVDTVKTTDQTGRGNPEILLSVKRKKNIFAYVVYL
jgi:hypothetical protein